MTGQQPGQHGVYDFMRVEDRGDEVFFTLYDFRDIRSETIWSIASRQGLGVAALNFPMMAPPPRIHGGSLIPGFTSWKHLRRNSTPADLFGRLGAIEGFNPRELAWDFERENEIGNEMSDAHLTAWVRYHLPREEQWYRVARFLMTEDRPELMAVMFDGTDKIQHQAWRVIDAGLRTGAAEDAELEALCMEYYRRLDGYLGSLVGLAGPDAQIFMASDHGFTTTTEVVRINRYLADLGYLSYRQVPDTPEGRRRADSPFAYLDWGRTLAYCPTPSSNAIKIRVSQAPGAPGIAPAEYPAFRERLIQDLYALRAPNDDRPVITRVMTREEVFPGRAMADAPDLTLSLRDHGFVSIRNLAPVVVRRTYPIGTHHPEGVFLAAGPGIRTGAAGEPEEIANVAATLLYSAGLPVPADFAGRVVSAALEPAYLRDRPVTHGPATLPLENGEVREAPIPEADRQKILDQLAQLGYLEE
jgi:predicted AlkP superfamily phosphohydrolase/phosphomutase